MFYVQLHSGYIGIVKNNGVETADKILRIYMLYLELKWEYHCTGEMPELIKEVAKVYIKCNGRRIYIYDFNESFTVSFYRYGELIPYLNKVYNMDPEIYELHMGIFNRNK
jgi:hypothetical protein